ncbi:hypothetical protein L1987_08767 [Smallanthus sonchifolius]|uniref:Uncharacterized protein n=1 Tax=Smallanthus sonchifolius TaxID=185202 RepID=A0ACB9JM46_9ASTR|nr:hypothetical protein L1987_08767 [Smallanthus sonchifolius]
MLRIKRSVSARHSQTMDRNLICPVLLYLLHMVMEAQLKRLKFENRYGSPKLAGKKKSSHRSGAYKSVSVGESVSVPASAVLRLKRRISGFKQHIHHHLPTHTLHHLQPLSILCKDTIPTCIRYRINLEKYRWVQEVFVERERDESLSCASACVRHSARRRPKMSQVV